MEIMAGSESFPLFDDCLDDMVLKLLKDERRKMKGR